MLVLGVRASTKEMRFALLDHSDQGVSFLNADANNSMKFPASIETIEDKLLWLERELEALFRKHSIEKAVIKTSEYARPETKATRFTAYTEGVLLCFAKKKSIPIFLKTYTSLNTKSAEVMSYAADTLNLKTNKLWTSQMADAVVAAYFGKRF